MNAIRNHCQIRGAQRVRFRTNCFVIVTTGVGLQAKTKRLMYNQTREEGPSIEADHRDRLG